MELSNHCSEMPWRDENPAPVHMEQTVFLGVPDSGQLESHLHFGDRFDRYLEMAYSNLKN